MNTSYIGSLLREIVTTTQPKLLELPEARYRKSPQPGKWSPIQIIGHLIDSASNNHQRFVRAQLKKELVFPGYQQDDWVRLQAYQEADWELIVGLWINFNLHLASTMDQIPAMVRFQKRTEHNLQKIAWRAIPEDEAVSLEYFMRDYVGHLEFHLTQIFSDYQLIAPPYANE